MNYIIVGLEGKVLRKLVVITLEPNRKKTLMQKFAWSNLEEKLTLSSKT